MKSDTIVTIPYRLWVDIWNQMERIIWTEVTYMDNPLKMAQKTIKKHENMAADVRRWMAAQDSNLRKLPLLTRGDTDES